MSQRTISFVKVLLSIGLAGGLLYLVFKNVEWEAFWEKAVQVDYLWVFASILLSILAYVARAYRWNILFEPLGYSLKTSRTTLAVLVGYLANLVLPRLGEITRCGVLNRNDQVPVPVALGSVVTERIIDMITLLILIVVSFLLEAERLLTFLESAYRDLNIPGYVLVIVLVVGMLGVGLMIIFLRRQDRYRGKFATLFKEFLAGILSLKYIKRPLGFVLSTLVIWVVYYLMSYIIVFSLPETAHLGLGAGFMLLITGGIAISLPVQSGFGTYHGMIAGMLLLYNIDKTTGIFLATLLHTSQIIAIGLFGSIALIMSFFLRRAINKKLTN